jgi:predicted AlkP superfamily pyrophosphatase or phosphodiesterase
VTVVVDQLAAWVADARWPQLPPQGGFARLRREGTWVKDMRYAHATTDTAPGHAALYTGAPPRDSGIYGNESFTPAGKRVGIIEDPTTKTIAPDGPRDEASVSLAALKVETIADRLRAAHPEATIVAVSLKDRGAIFGGGRHPTASLWFSTSTLSFVTSSAFAAELPAWAIAHGSKAAVFEAEQTPWEVSDKAWLAAHVKTPDNQPGEGDLLGLGTTFPHTAFGASRPSIAFRATPLADELTLKLAFDGVEASTAGGPMLLAISLSSNDYVGHVFGPDSWEAWDTLWRIDAALARFFGQLDAKVGANGYSVVLTADHGIPDMPEMALVDGTRPWCKAKDDRWHRPCGKVGRVSAEALAVEVELAAESALGAGAWVSGIVDAYVVLSDTAKKLDAPGRAKLDKLVTTTLKKHQEVADVIDLRQLPDECPPISDESIAALVCRSVAKGARDYYVVLRPGSFFDTGYVPGKGCSHGSPYLFDRSVPLLVRAPGKVPAGRVVEGPVPFTLFTRTASALLGIEPPAAARSADCGATDAGVSESCTPKGLVEGKP